MTLQERIRMYEVEVLRGADTTEVMRYWGPTDEEKLVNELYNEGLHAIAYSWDDDDAVL